MFIKNTFLTNLNYYQMKKGLLSFLALAGVLVSCQNYDDQFDALNTEIERLQTQLGGLTDIENDIADLTTGLAALSQSVQDLQTGTTNNATAIGQLMSDLAALQTNLAAVRTAVDNIDVQAQVDAATADIDAEVLNLEEEIDDIWAAIQDLLDRAAIIEQDVRITNLAELDYAETLFTFESDTDVVSSVIVKGNVIIDIDGAGDELNTTANLARINAITTMIGTVIQGLSGSDILLTNASSTTIAFGNLTYADGSVTLQGLSSIDAITTITGNLSFDAIEAAISFPSLTSVRDVVILSDVGITSIDLSNISDVEGDLFVGTGAASNMLILNNATSVNIGGLSIPSVVQLAQGSFTSTADDNFSGTISATSIAIASATIASSTLTADGAVSVAAISGGASDTSITTDGAISVAGGVVANVATLSGSSIAITGNVSLTSATTFTSSNTTIGGNTSGAALTIDSALGTFALTGNASSVLTVTASTTTLGGNINQAVTLTGNGGSLAMNGDQINANLTATVDTFTSPNVDTIAAGAALLVNDATAMTLPELTTNAGTITGPAVVTFTAVQLKDGNTIDIAADATVSVGSVSDTANHTDFTTYNSLTVSAQDSDLDISTGARIATFNVTGKANADLTAQDNDITVTGNASLTSIVIGSTSVLSSLNVSNTTLESLTTAGKIRILDITNNDDMTSFTFGHGHVQPGPASTVIVAGNASLTTLNMSSLTKVATITIDNNADLASITAPSISSNPNEMATTLANIGVTVTRNDVDATYTDATAATGTTTYVAASLTVATSALSGFKAFVNYYLNQTGRSGNVSFSFGFDYGTGTGPSADTAAQNGADGTAGNADDQLHNNNDEIDGDFTNNEELDMLADGN